MGPQRTVLVVDDDPKLVEAVMDRLHHAGFKATAAYDRAEAMIQAGALRPALIICDINMPIFGTGVDAYKDFRKNPKLKDTPVIFMTGLPLEQAKALVPFSDPKVRLLKKPVNWVMLEQAMGELIGTGGPLE